MSSESDEQQDQSVGSYPPPVDKHTVTALEYLIYNLDKRFKFKNGKTALMWHMMHTMSLHLEPKE